MSFGWIERHSNTGGKKITEKGYFHTVFYCFLAKRDK